MPILALSVACGDDSGPAGDTGGRDTAGRDTNSVDAPIDVMMQPPSDECGSVRLTSYNVFARGWCEWDTDYAFLPQFVRSGMTAAIAEPYNGGTYGGDPGEACGECWEVDTVNGTEIVMIADLCPIEGNPLCAGEHFHLDLTSEAAQVVGGGGLDQAQARRVPCPIDGNIHVLVNDDNNTYLRVAFMNFTAPIRSIEFRGAGPGVDANNEWTPLRRSGGAWEVIGGDRPTDRGGTGVNFRITSAQGEVVESSVIVDSHPPQGTTYDLGVQFADVEPAIGGACEFVPPGDIYVNEFGGIPEVRWMINPWGQAEQGFFGETSDGCFEGSCIEVATLGQWTGFHLYYRQSFDVTYFSTLQLRVRTRSGAAELVIGPTLEGTRCPPTSLSVGTEWVDVSYDLSACNGRIDAVTIDSGGAETVALLVDDVRLIP